MLPSVMETIQKGGGIFILIDITLMLIYWLLHLYHAYFTFQEGPLPASASALIILAEFSRVFLLSDTSTKFTADAENVIARLEDEKTVAEEEHDKQVLIRKLKRWSHISACGFFKE